MNDEILEQATKVMHAEVCCPCDPKGCDWTHTPEARYARALADAGLLARPLPTREEIADELNGWLIWSGYYQTQVTIDAARDMADVVLDILKGQEA